MNIAQAAGEQYLLWKSPSYSDVFVFLCSLTAVWRSGLQHSDPDQKNPTYHFTLAHCLVTW